MSMAVQFTLGYARASDKRAGEFVARGGRAYEILEVCHEGRNAPYYRLEGYDNSAWDTAEKPGWVSWQTCGDVRQ